MAHGKTNAGGGRQYDFTGNAVPNDVLDGKTFFSNDPMNKQTGAMPNRAGENIAAHPEVEGNQYRLKIPAKGYYDESSRLFRTNVNVASDIGLTASKIVQGNTILGVVGTGAATVGIAQATGVSMNKTSPSAGVTDNNITAQTAHIPIGFVVFLSASDTILGGAAAKGGGSPAIISGNTLGIRATYWGGSSFSFTVTAQSHFDAGSPYVFYYYLI